MGQTRRPRQRRGREQREIKMSSTGGDESVQLQQAKIEYYYSSATCQLKVKKDQQSLRFLLESKNVTFDDFDVCLDQMRKAEMQAKRGKASLPQLFVDDRFVGGYDEVQYMEELGTLDQVLFKEVDGV